jgi:signal transduction histidine kinase
LSHSFASALPAGAASEVLETALASAGRRAAQALALSEHKTVEEFRAQFQQMSDILLALSRGDAVQDDDPAFNTPRRFVDVFRAELLEVLNEATPSAVWADPALARDTIAVLSAIEEFIRRGERTSTGRFVARLAGAESVTAVVEIAHDIRSPLSSILFLVDTIRRGKSGPVSPIQERQLGLVYGAALGLSTLSSDLIDAVRGERLVDGRAVPFSVTEVILGVCAIVDPIGEEKGLPLNVEFPEIDGRIGYPSAIHRVLLNLTSNALRYTDTGFVSIGCVEYDDDIIEFSIQDTGNGIPDNVLAMLFDGFRPTPTGMRFSSAGLGLAISRTLLEAMGSTLAVESSPERGTRFSFRLQLPVA